MNTAPNSTNWIWSLVSSSTFQSVLGVLILLTVCGIAISLLSKLRDSNTQDAPMDEMLRKNFEEMRSEGVINEAEFRNIASLLAEAPRKNSAVKPKTIEQTDAPNSDEK
jgi:hypothetical protein